jgi:hypothetical protein
MKKLLYILALAFAIAAVAVIATGFYLFRKVSYTPQWYEEPPSAGVWVADTADTSIDESIQKIENDVVARGKSPVPEKMVVPVLLRQAGRRSSVDIKSMVKAAKVSRGTGRLGVEMVVDVNKLPREKLPPEARAAADKLLGMMPESMLKDLYVKVDFAGNKEGGALSFDPDSKLTIGKMEFTIGELEKITGLKSNEVLKSMGLNNFSITDSGLSVRR